MHSEAPASEVRNVGNDGSHAAQSSAPECGACLPASQGVHFVAYKELLDPGGQRPEQVELFWPSLAPKAPASQGRQSVRAPLAYVPLVHGVQPCSPYGRVVPASQGSQDVPAAFTMVPASQGLQPKEPGSERPASPQGVHSPTSPRLNVLRGQGRHSVPSALERVPIEQSEQNEAPESGAT